jgi:hypothetical protein
METLVALLVVVVVIWLVMYLISALPITEPWGTVLRVLVILALLVYVVRRFGVLG